MAELKPGYKLTEVGVIPDDWDMKQLGTCLLHTPQYGINAPAVQYTDNLPTYIRITDITEDGRFSPEKLVSVDHPAAGNYFLNEGDLVFARTGASVGKSYLYDPADGKLVYAGFLIRVGIDTSKLIPSYLAHYVKTEQYWNWVKMMSMRSGQPGINGNEYAQLLIPLPPTLDEQYAIAKALNEVDEQIAALDDLIAKKHDLKQAAMQRLLTGEERLPGFDGDWEQKQLGECGNWRGGGTPSKSVAKYWLNGSIPWISSGDVKKTRLTQTTYYITDEAILNSSTTYLEAGAIIIVTRSGILRKYLPVALNVIPMAINQDIKALIPAKDVDSEFLLHSITKSGEDILIRCLKTGTTVESIEFKWLKGYQIHIPPTLEEQKAVATVLSEMDTEISTLEVKREKTVALKQGMMQELLTGKTRLI